MKRTTRIPALIAVLAMAVATITQIASAQSSDERAIRAAGEAWQRWTREQKNDSVAALFTADAVFMLGNAAPVKGSAAIGSAWADYAKTPGLDVRWTPQKIDVTSPTRAVETGTYTESYDTPDGKVRDAGTYVTIWNKVGGKWRIALDAPVSSMALQSTSAVEMGDVQLLGSDKLVWSDFSVPGFDPGVKMAVIHGNPMAKGDYTLRLKLPDGYKFPVHWHPGGEHVTVISGTFLLAMGSSGDWSAMQSYPAGSFVYAPPRHPHYGGVRGETVVQLHGEGPFAINLGAPK